MASDEEYRLVKRQMDKEPPAEFWQWVAGVISSDPCGRLLEEHSTSAQLLGLTLEALWMRLWEVSAPSPSRALDKLIGAKDG
jgi:hypothetical protein